VNLPSHPVVFVEVSVPDLSAGATFFERAVGWELDGVHAGGDSAAPVVMMRARTGAKPNLGLVSGEPGASGTRVFLLCDDLAASVSNWVDAGGSARGAVESFLGLGRRQNVLDPWGNEFVLWVWAAGRGWSPAAD